MFIASDAATSQYILADIFLACWTDRAYQGKSGEVSPLIKCKSIKEKCI